MKICFLSKKDIPSEREALMRMIDSLPFGEDEQTRLRAFQNDNVMAQSLGALLALQTCIGEKTVAKIARTENGKPYFVGTDMPAFSLSHADPLCVAACAEDGEGSVGVDLEWIRDSLDTNAVAKRFFTEEEQQMLSDSRSPQDDFFCLWTKKEAKVKMLGTHFLAKTSLDHISYSSYRIEINGRVGYLSVATEKPIKNIEWMGAKDLCIHDLSK